MLYKKQTPFSISDSTNEDAREIQSTNDEEEDELSENDEDINTNDDCINFLPQSEELIDLIDDVSDHDINISTLIQKVRKIVKRFRKSPLKNEKLQKYVVNEHGKELALTLDTKVRWNSLLSMLERFIQVKTALAKALIDLNSQLCISGIEFEQLDIIVRSLIPIRIGAEKLCSRDSTLLTAETIFSFMIE